MPKAKPYCDCNDLRHVNGLQRDKFYKLSNEMLVTKVNSDDRCVYCGHYAYFSVDAPRTINHSSKSPTALKGAG